METFNDLPVMSFVEPEAWRDWLDRHHGDSAGLWLRIYKKGSGQPTISYAEALDEALCYGWIDSTKAAYDAASFLQRFTPRRARSVWSQVNQAHVARLSAAGRMQTAGLRVVELAKSNGQWEAAYAPQSQSTVPDDLQAALDAEPAAQAFFDGLNRVNRHAFVYRIQSVKTPVARSRRIAWAIDRLLRQEPLH
jgi:uncharacterized protein YdeI (YjbR/CyaY-like superfamily)